MILLSISLLVKSPQRNERINPFVLFYFNVADSRITIGTIRYNLDPFKEHDDEEIWKALTLVRLRDVVEQLDGTFLCPPYIIQLSQIWKKSFMLNVILFCYKTIIR
jgi:hypothetical protein